MEKLQIIVLFEVDFNMNNKWIGRAVMYTVDKLQALAPEQYGSQKSKAANIQSLNKCLFYDMIRSNQQMVALCSNDTKSCYNRIVLLIAALVMCQLGGQENWLKSMVNMLAAITHQKVNLVL